VRAFKHGYSCITVFSVCVRVVCVCCVCVIFVDIYIKEGRVDIKNDDESRNDNENY